jgi:hypothetical protein
LSQISFSYDAIFSFRELQIEGFVADFSPFYANLRDICSKNFSAFFQG